MIEQVWSEQPPGHYCLSRKSPSGKWEDKIFGSSSEAMSWLKDNKRSGDLYFCTTTLSAPRRVKENVQSSRYLWQDLDNVNPSELGKLRPTIAWQSSPGRYQALWKLNDVYEPDRIEALNQALAYKVGADQGSWILTKVLRIPGTRNYKYNNKPIVKMLWDDGAVFKIDRLEKQLKVSSKERNEGELVIDLTLDFKKVFKKYKNKMSHKIRRLLTADEAVQGKRSSILWFLEHELIKAGLSKAEVFSLIKGSVWNKYRGRDDEDNRIRTEILKVTSESKERKIDTDPVGDNDDEPMFSMVLQNDNELLSDISSYPGWMVEGFWTRKSHGIVAGEPKSFKSTLILDLAVSIASGCKFLGVFETIDTGPVLVVQNENAPWIMKDRLIKIRSDRGLIGQIEKVRGLYQVTFPPQLPLYYINQQGFNLNETHHRKILDKVMSSINPKMVIFDPLYLMFDGDINQSKDLNPVLNWLLSLKDKHNCSLILIHHWKKGTTKSGLRGGQRMLGSTTLHGWVESAWYLDVKKADDLEEEIFSDELNAPGGSILLTLEREFRGAGTYPKVDLIVTMGDFGDTKYSVDVKRHRKERISIDDKEVKESIESLMELRGGKLSLREASKELGISRKSASRLIKEIREGKENNG